MKASAAPAMTVHQPPLQDHALIPAEVFAMIVAETAKISRSRRVDLDAALGCVVAGDVHSARPLPYFDQSAVDGYAIGAPIEAVTLPARLTVTGFAAAAAAPLKPGQSMRIATGAVVPAGAIAVVMREYCRKDGDDVLVDRVTAAGANIRLRGEDVAVGSVLVESHTLIDARHIAILASAGSEHVEVVDCLRVAVVSSGNELRPVGDGTEGHQIYDANRPMLRALLRAPWIELIDGGIVADDTQALGAQLSALALTVDAIVMSGGASGSDTDHTAAAIATFGGVARSVRIAQRPGKPIVVGSIGGVPIMGLPGNTTAAMVNCMLYARPMLMARAGLAPTRPRGQPAVALSAFEHTPMRTDFVPARVVQHGADGRPMLEQLSRGGSTRLRPYVEADGIAELPPEIERVESGSSIIFHPFRNGLST